MGSSRRACRSTRQTNPQIKCTNPSCRARHPSRAEGEHQCRRCRDADQSLAQGATLATGGCPGSEQGRGQAHGKREKRNGQAVPAEPNNRAQQPTSRELSSRMNRAVLPSRRFEEHYEVWLFARHDAAGRMHTPTLSPGLFVAKKMAPQQHSGIPHPVISLTRPHPHLPHIWRTFYGQLGELLGVGGYGEVFKCIRLGDMARRPFAVKKVKGKKPSDGGPEVVTSTSTMR